jgi:hypothetical protein
LNVEEMDTSQLLYEAPILKYEEIAEIISEMQIPTHEIKTPTPQLVRKVYGRFMERIFNKSTNELLMPSIKIDFLETPENHDTSISELEFRKNL